MRGRKYAFCSSLPKRMSVGPTVLSVTSGMATPARWASSQDASITRRVGKQCGGGTRWAEAVIIEAAINGVTSKKHNPNTPKEPAEIADDALRCFAAGAAVVHNHIDSFALDGDRAAERYLE